jgi:hypothetical protein
MTLTHTNEESLGIRVHNTHERRTDDDAGRWHMELQASSGGWGMGSQKSRLRWPRYIQQSTEGYLFEHHKLQISTRQYNQLPHE